MSPIARREQENEHRFNFCVLPAQVSGGGKVMARHPGKQHLNEKLDRESKVELSSMFVVHKGDIPNIIKCMPHAKIGGSH